jgi:nitrate reductase delta subunit
MSAAYKALSALLAYPSEELVDALPDIATVFAAESRLDGEQRRALASLVDWLGRSDLLDAQECYVGLFDRGRATSLHLFEHVHGDSRARGQAMVELQALYAKAGLRPSVNELPDYLPMMLEYLSLANENEARDMLGDCAHIVRAIGEALAGRGSRYAAVLSAILAIVGEPGLAPSREPGQATSDAALDDEWVEEPVHFGPPGGAGCGTSQSQTSVVRIVPRPS